MRATLPTQIGLELIPYRHSATACRNLKTSCMTPCRWLCCVSSGCSRGNAPKHCTDAWRCSPSEDSSRPGGGFMGNSQTSDSELTRQDLPRTRREPVGRLLQRLCVCDSQWICRGFLEALQGDSGRTDRGIRQQLVEKEGLQRTCTGQIEDLQTIDRWLARAH